MTKCNPDIHHRRSIRLKEYDYSKEGLYFVTIGVQNRECLFGEIIVETYVVGAGSARPTGFTSPDIGQANPAPAMQLNEYGMIGEQEWFALKNKYPNIDLHEFIVMPNHIHGILEIVSPFVGTDVCTGEPHPDIRAGEPRPYNVPTLGNVVAYFKYKTTKRIDLSTKLWQRNYHEHIIRDEKSYQTISEYIINNPANWMTDKFNPNQNQNNQSNNHSLNEEN